MRVDNGLLIQAIYSDDILKEAFAKNNSRFIDGLPESLEIHGFSRGFEKRMNRLISADKKFGGRVWLERSTRYLVRVVAMVLCFIMINFVSVKAFDFNIWEAIVTKTGEFINIDFNKHGVIEDNTQVARMKITNIPSGYTEQQSYNSPNMSVQQLVSKNGSITYNESLISETAEIHILSGSQQTDNIRGYEVKYFEGEDSFTAFFCDSEFYHIIEIQGIDANKKFADKIIKELEEQ